MEVFIYGDSHADRSFRNTPYTNFFQTGVTMYRIGRDNMITNFDPSMHTKNSIIVLHYGEIDCRNHIKKQIDKGRDEDTIIKELVNCYFETIKNNVLNYKHIVIIAVMPPFERYNYDSLYGSSLPFVGTDEERVRYTEKMNQVLQSKCSEYEYIFFDPFEYYKNEKKCLKIELSDSDVHLGNNAHFIQKFGELLTEISPEKY